MYINVIFFFGSLKDNSGKNESVLLDFQVYLGFLILLKNFIILFYCVNINYYKNHNVIYKNI